MKTRPDTIAFSKIAIGMAFRSGAFTYIKTPFKEIADYQGINAVSLEDGRTWCLADDVPCTPVKCLGFIEDYLHT